MTLNLAGEAPWPLSSTRLYNVVLLNEVMDRIILTNAFILCVKSFLIHLSFYPSFPITPDSFLLYMNVEI